MKRAPNKEFDLKFVIRRSPAHMGVQDGRAHLLQWLNSFIFFNTMNGELDKLHRKWLGRADGAAADAVRCAGASERGAW